MSQPVNPLSIYKYCPNCKSDLELRVIDATKIRACSACGFIFWNNPKPAVSIILHKDGKVLMLQRAGEPFKDYWVLPGGFMKYDETPREAIARETGEEIGVPVTPGGIVGAYQVDTDPRGMHIDIVFEGQLSGTVAWSGEDSDWRLFDPEALPEHIAYKHRRAIADWCAKKFG